MVNPATVNTCQEPVWVNAACLKPTCHSKSGDCLFEPANNGLFCEDGNACTAGSTCQAGTCSGGTSVNCNDGNLCTDDSCVPATGCQHSPNAVPGNDGNACTSDSCSAQTGCVYTPTVPCCGNGVKEGAEACDKTDATACPGNCQADCTCKSYHNSVTFVPTATADGCSYNNCHAIKWLNLGNMTWKECAVEASKRGAMMAPQAYTVSVGWCSHRKGSVAMTGKWSTYQEADISSQQPCILARDPHATINNAPLNQTVTYDGMTWHYQNHGTKYYDECQTLAGNAGAMIITPYTIGQSGDNYWINSVHMCNTYEWITGGGTNYGNDNIGSGARSSQRTCMVGYVD